MNIKKFAILDMLLLTIFAIGSEFVGHIINSQLLYISFAQVFILLMVVRWRVWALIPIVITATARVLIFRAQGFNEIVLYFIPMLLMSLSILAMRLKYFKKINDNKYTGIILFTIMYFIFYLSTGILTKLLVSNDYSFLNDAITKHLLNYVIGVIIMFMFANQRTMLVDIIGNYKNNVKESEINGS